MEAERDGVPSANASCSFLPILYLSFLVCMHTPEGQGHSRAAQLDGDPMTPAVLRLTVHHLVEHCLPLLREGGREGERGEGREEILMSSHTCTYY